MTRITPDEAKAMLASGNIYVTLMEMDAAQAIEFVEAMLQTIIDMGAELERYHHAIERLGSLETMTNPFARRDNEEGMELLARIEFARAALTLNTDGDVK